MEKELSNRIASTKKTDLIAENPAHTSISETAYRTKILLIIDKIEQVQKFYELNDFDSCEDQLEMAEYLIEEFCIDY